MKHSKPIKKFRRGQKVIYSFECEVVRILKDGTITVRSGMIDYDVDEKDITEK